MAAELPSGLQQNRLTLELFEALSSSLDLKVVLERAFPLLTRLVAADYGALGLSSTGRSDDYQWIVASIPPAFFASYPEMAEHDFVRRAVVERPNVVLRDQQMSARTELERNVMYRRAREVGAPLEHVMAVMLHVDRWESGLSLFRGERCPFSARDCSVLQDVTPAIVNTVTNCQKFGSAASWAVAVSTLLQSRGAAIVLISSSVEVVEQSEGAALMLAKWFALHERRDGHLPAVLQAFAAACASRPFGRHAPMTLHGESGGSTLEISFVTLSGCTGRATAMLVLEEREGSLRPPRAWAGILTARELEVSRAVLRGWDNRLISAELGCAEATVKKHLQNIFDKLGVETRTALVMRGASAWRPSPDDPDEPDDSH